MESELIIGFHRSRELAERHARKINGKIVSRRNSSGKFSNRGHWFTFKLQPKELTRYTVGITFPFKKEYGSVLSQLYTSKWKKKATSKRAKRDQAATLEAAIKKVEEIVRYPRAKFWFDLEAVTAIETQTVPFDESFAERIVVLSEVEDESKTVTYRRK